MNKKFEGFSQNFLKVTAFLFMVLNHFCFLYCRNIPNGSYFLNHAHWYLSRFSFILFAFFISEGMIYTRNRITYLKNLFLFALLSEIPFDLCLFDSFFHWEYQNVIFTLFLGAFAIFLSDIYGKNSSSKVIILLSCSLISIFLHTDYSFTGVFLIYCFYVFRNNKKERLVFPFAIYLILIFMKRFFAYYSPGINESILFSAVQNEFSKEAHCLIAFPLIALYNGKRGNKISKWIFYIAYPAHIILLRFLIELIK